MRGKIVSDDFYHDDPIAEKTSRKFRSNLLAPFAFIVASVFFFQSTFAGNITLSSGSGVEFGQGFTATTACSGSTNLTLTPNSSFVNAPGSGGRHYFSSVTVSGIPLTCDGAQFQINAYGNSDQTPLAIYNDTSTNVIVADTGGGFGLDVRASGITLATNSSSSFTVSFVTPVATSDAVFKLTIQSAINTLSVRANYNLGATGPGGGRIFYVNEAGFNCGPTHSATGSPTGGLCNYLEVAPVTWDSVSDPIKRWANAGDYNYDVVGVTKQNSGWNTSAGVGLGYKDSVAIVTNGRSMDANTAAFSARAYSGGSKSDWYLGSPVELNLLCQWARGVPSNITTGCTGGTLNSATYGASTAGINGSAYWSSTQDNGFPPYAVRLNFGDGSQGTALKNSLLRVRPIRAF